MLVFAVRVVYRSPIQPSSYELDSEANTRLCVRICDVWPMLPV